MKKTLIALIALATFSNAFSALAAESRMSIFSCVDSKNPSALILKAHFNNTLDRVQGMEVFDKELVDLMVFKSCRKVDRMSASYPFKYNLTRVMTFDAREDDDYTPKPFLGNAPTTWYWIPGYRKTELCGYRVDFFVLAADLDKKEFKAQIEVFYAPDQDYSTSGTENRMICRRE